MKSFTHCELEALLKPSVAAVLCASSQLPRGDMILNHFRARMYSRPYVWTVGTIWAAEAPVRGPCRELATTLSRVD